jgi:hypothetical protein
MRNVWWHQTFPCPPTRAHPQPLCSSLGSEDMRGYFPGWNMDTFLRERYAHAQLLPQRRFGRLFNYILGVSGSHMIFWHMIAAGIAIAASSIVTPV